MQFRVPVPPSGQYTYYPGTSGGAGALAGQRPRRSRTRSWPRWSSPAEPRASSSPGSRFGGHACSSRTAQLSYVYNFLGIPPEQTLVGPRPERAPTSSAWSSPRSAWASTTSRTGTLKLYIDDEVVAEGEMRTMTGLLLAVRRRPVHRLRRRRRGQQRVHPEVRVHRRHGSSRSSSTSPTTATSTSSGTWPPPWPATDESPGPGDPGGGPAAPEWAFGSSSRTPDRRRPGTILPLEDRHAPGWQAEHPGHLG